MPKIGKFEKLLDRKVVALGITGKHAGYIAEQTGYSVGQIRTRLKRAGVTLRDYRDGEGWFAKATDAMMQEHEFRDRVYADISRKLKQDEREARARLASGMRKLTKNATKTR